MLDTEDDIRPSSESSEKIYNSFLNHCVIIKDDGFEVYSINNLCNFSEVTDSVQRLWQEYFSLIDLSSLEIHFDLLHKPYVSSYFKLLRQTTV